MAKLTQEGIDKAKRGLEQELAGARPGISVVAANLTPGPVTIGKVRYSAIDNVNPELLKPNPRNPYVRLDDEKLKVMADDMREHGVYNPLIIDKNSNIICGENRYCASIIAKLPSVPVRTVLSELTPELELRIMRRENDLRRGGKWSTDKKKDFIENNFAEELAKDRRGGNRGNQHVGGRKAASIADATLPLPERIEEASRGQITRHQAKRLITEKRRETIQAKKKEKSKPKTMHTFPPDFTQILASLEKAFKSESRQARIILAKHLRGLAKRLSV